MLYLERPEESVGFSGTRVVMSHQVGVGNQTQVWQIFLTTEQSLHTTKVVSLLTEVFVYDFFKFHLVPKDLKLTCEFINLHPSLIRPPKEINDF